MNSKTTGVDMSSEAIDRRLRRVSELWELGMRLKRAKRLGKVKDLEASASGYGQDPHEQSH